MTSEQWAIAGIVISIILAIPGFFAAKSIRRASQKQSVKNGTGYQAGGNINVDNRNE